VEIYIKPLEKVKIIKSQTVYLKDLAEVYAEGGIKKRAEELVVFKIPSERKKTYLLSVIDLITVIHQHFPKADLNNVGESDILVEFLPEAGKERRFWTLAKVVFVSCILFIGAATTIMCFHTDVQLSLIFQNVYYIFYGENREMPPLLSIPYSIGLGLGIIIFFNHFSDISLTEDPTPIEIEMTTYEQETNASVIDYLNRKRRKRE